ncbi:MAG: tRNA-(ms[2]io[6]A)-hydroxylase [Spirochaetaceae bacterium]|nr:tRNA-(ms[2]io[6]A)-hydroxylase [Myxococcales bacterium]MCB9726189.1 tRNA-(ms[2]io[6]A)-hydroxylase [Spirochaetaceae bacterium]HPG25842.1 tRNA isopentenyl-2-thiomethyl-A-37 hydroxylase MiaE [Myxococcota bacterium]
MVDSAAVLHLASTTPPEWLARARAALDDVLLDHAHCEKKAAGAAVKLLFSYPHHRFLQEPLALLAGEELDHFRILLARLDARGVRYRSIRPGPYGMALHALVRRDEPDRLLDLLLISALIEARSCERFQLLADGLAGDEPEVAALYGSLLASEARHHGLYLALATELVGRPAMERRLEVLSAEEARIVGEPWEGVRLHAG